MRLRKANHHACWCKWFASSWKHQYRLKAFHLPSVTPAHRSLHSHPIEHPKRHKPIVTQQSHPDHIQIAQPICGSALEPLSMHQRSGTFLARPGCIHGLCICVEVIIVATPNDQNSLNWEQSGCEAAITRCRTLPSAPTRYEVFALGSRTSVW